MASQANPPPTNSWTLVARGTASQVWNAVAWDLK